MVDGGGQYTKPQRLGVPSTNAQIKNNPRKFYNHFLFRTLIVIVSLVIIPLFNPEQSDVEYPSIFTRVWELVQLIFVGIAVSYGLFSRKNDESDGENNVKFDNGQGYMSKLLHVTSIFDEEGDGVPSGCDDNDENVKKVETWSSQYIRNEPMLVVAEKNCVVDKNHGVNGENEKPLLLPVRSLKSRVSDEKDGGLVSREDYGAPRVYTRSNTSPIVKGFANDSKRLDRNHVIGLVNGEELGVGTIGYGRSNSSLGEKRFTGGSKGISSNGSVKSRVEVSNEVGFVDGDRKVLKSLSRSNSRVGSRDFSGTTRKSSSLSGNYDALGDGSVEGHERKVEESVVLPSPIPWRSRSGRMEMKREPDEYSTHSLPPSLEESEAARLLKPQLSLSNSSSSTPLESSPRKLSHSRTLSSESEAKSVEDFGRRKSNYSSHLPPPPPPPPPPSTPSPSTTYRPRVAKSFSSKDEGEISSPHKDFKRSVCSEPKDSGWGSTDDNFNGTNEGYQVKTRNGVDSTSVGRSVRTIRPDETENPSSDYNPRSKSSFSEYPKETRDFLEQVLVETDDESESEGENYREHLEQRVEKEKVDEAPAENVKDEESDIDKNVDKKADEFIAKFREQIRLQRIESIKKSTGQLKRSFAM